MGHGSVVSQPNLRESLPRTGARARCSAVTRFECSSPRTGWKCVQADCLSMSFLTDMSRISSAAAASARVAAA